MSGPRRKDDRPGSRRVPLRADSGSSDRRLTGQLCRYTNDAALLFDRRLRLVDCNDRALELYGCARDELLGSSAHDLHAEGAPPFPKAPSQLREHVGLVCESVHRRRDGSAFPVEMSLRLVDHGGATYYHAVVRDISERRSNEAELRRTVDLLAQAERTARIGHWAWDRETGACVPSPGLLAIFGLEQGADATPDTLDALVHPEDREAYRDAVARLIRGEHVTFAWRIVRPDGELRYLEGVGEPRCDDRGELAAAFGVTQDVTERVLAEGARRRQAELLRRTEEDLGRIMSALVENVVTLDVDGRITYINHTEPGIGESEVIGSRWLDWLDEAARPEAAAALRRAQETGEVQEVDFPALGPRRESTWYRVRMTRMPEGSRDAVVLLATDITAQRDAEEERRRAADVLRASQTKLEVALASMTDAVFISDTEGNFVDFNDAFATYHRFPTRDECLKTFAEYPDLFEVYLDTGEPAPLDMWAVPRALRGETAVDAEYGVRRKDTGERWVGSYSFAPMRNDAGDIIGSVVLARDITERRQAEQALAAREAEALEMVDRLSRAQALGHVGDWDWDVRSGAVTWSPEVYRIFGVDADFETTFDSIMAMIPHDLRDAHLRRVEKLMADRSRSEGPLSFRLVRPDGEAREIDQTVVVERDEAGSARRMYGLIRDVTELRRAELARVASEARLRRLNLELEERVEERTDELKRSNEALESFTYSVSHDLRAPLRHISGYSHLLAEHLGDDLDDEARHFLGVIVASAREMGQLIDDLLLLSRLGRAELRLAEVDMAVCAREALAPLLRDEPERRVEVSIAELPSVRGDRALLRQAWANLLGNAVKYTRGREVARLEVGARHDGDDTVFFVRDNGVGFDMAYADKLFAVFQRLHSAGDFEGTGVGLAIVKRIVERHGGCVWAQAAVDQGATFFFTIPDETGAVQ